MNMSFMDATALGMMTGLQMSSEHNLEAVIGMAREVANESAVGAHLLHAMLNPQFIKETMSFLQTGNETELANMDNQFEALMKPDLLRVMKEDLQANNRSSAVLHLMGGPGGASSWLHGHFQPGSMGANLMQMVQAAEASKDGAKAVEVTSAPAASLLELVGAELAEPDTNA